eukprot:8009346-Karenia_brevis.AAC.1
MQQTRNESSGDAFTSAFDDLSHDLRRDEKCRGRGVRTKKWPSKEVDGKLVYSGSVDMVGQNFQLIPNFRAKVVQRRNGQYVIIHNQAMP